MANKKHSIWQNYSWWMLIALGLIFLPGPDLYAYALQIDYDTQDLLLGATAPSWNHVLGTDMLGRDIFMRLLYGGQVSVLVGLFASFTACCIGVFYGMFSGFSGGWIDEVCMRVVDILSSLPYMFVVIICNALFGQQFFILFIVLGLLGWLTTARLVRAHVLHLREAEFILAARVLGVGEWTMMWRHLLPHILPTVLCLFALQTPQFILEEAFLSFMGLGVQAPRPSLGSLIAEGSRHMSIFPWELWFPAATLALMLASLQIFGKTLEKRWSISE